jgi:hypothetical protein
VRGPDRAVSVLGAPVGAVHPLVEVAQHHALRVAVLSVADRLGFGLVAEVAEREASELMPAAGTVVDVPDRPTVDTGPGR